MGWALFWFAIYLAIMFYLGIVGMQKIKDFKSFSIAERDVRGFFIGICLMASIFSASTYMGVPGMAYKFGWPVFWIWVSFQISPLLAIMLAARRTWLQADVLKPNSYSDFIGARYQSSALRVFISIATIILFLPTMQAQMKGAGLVFETLTGYPYWLGIAIAGGIVAIYCVMGAMYADIYTDFLQGIIMIVGALIVVPWALVTVGGLSGLFAKEAALKPEVLNMFATSVFDPIGAVSNIPYWFLIFLTMPYLVNKYFTLSDVSNKTMKTLTLSFVVTTIAGALMSLGGLVAFAMMPNLKNADYAILSLSESLLPGFLSSFLLVTIFAAIMSSVDGIALAVSYAISNDLYYRMVKKPSDPEGQKRIDRKALLIGRISIISVILIGSLLAAVKPPELLSLLLYVGLGGIATVSVGPYLVGLFWKRATSTAALVSSVGSLALYLLLIFGTKVGVYFATTIASVVGILTVIVVSRFTPQLPAEFINNLFKRDIKTNNISSAG